MAKPSDPDIVFSSGFVVRKNLVYVLTEYEGKDPQGNLATVMVKFMGGTHGHVLVPFRGLIGIDALAGKDAQRPADLTVVSVEGDFLRSGSDVSREVGEMDPGESGPSRRGWIRSLRRIGQKLYAVGMSRQVYERPPAGDWRHIDADLLAGPVTDPKKAVGLNDIDGFSAKEIYAAGLKGEIWRYDGKRWHSVKSPTNVQLNAVNRIGDFIYIVGGSGVVLRGRGDDFDVVATQDDKDNLYDIEAFGDAIYVASLREVFVLEDDALAAVDTGLKGEITAGSLSSADGIMWSVGGKHLIVTEDGTTWTQRFL